jgi:hypothetical protein
LKSSLDVKQLKYLSTLFALLAACGGAHKNNPTPVTPTHNAALDAYLTALPPWKTPTPPSDTQTSSGPSYTDTAVDPKTQQTVTFQCVNYEHDVTKNYDQILWLDGVTSAVKPGIVLQGEAFKSGNLLPVPLRRSAATVSIDLGVDNPTRTVDEASTATLQSAVSALQAEADKLPDLPATLTFTSEEVQTSEQLAYSLGVHASYDGLLVSAGFDASFSHETGLTQHTVTAKLVQPMYTISFADDELATPADFFAKDLTDADWKAQAELGTISSTNTPVFISSVTYGRMLMFTVESTQGESATDLSAAIRASASAYSGSANTDVSAKETLMRSKIQVLAIGGSNQAAAAALTSGDLSQFFTKTNATGAVPISFIVKTVNGTREIALLGDVTKYSAPKCQIAAPKQTGWMAVTAPGKVFTSISVANASWVRASASDGIYGQNGDGSFSLWWPMQNVKQVSIGIDSTMAFIAMDGSIYTAGPNLGWQHVFGWATCIDVYDQYHAAHCGSGGNIYTGDITGNTWVNRGGVTSHLAIDGQGTVWSTGSPNGVYSWNPVAGWKQLDQSNFTATADAIGVGAPGDLYVVSGGSNYHYDQANNAFGQLSTSPVMAQIDVGFDGALFGIGTDGRIYRWQN